MAEYSFNYDAGEKWWKLENNVLYRYYENFGMRISYKVSVSAPLTVLSYDNNNIQFLDSKGDKYNNGTNGYYLMQKAKPDHPTIEPDICKRWKYDSTSNTYIQIFDPIDKVPRVGYKHVYDFTNDKWDEVINTKYTHKASSINLASGMMGMVKK